MAEDDIVQRVVITADDQATALLNRPCRYGRDHCCRLKRRIEARIPAIEPESYSSDIEWRWAPQETPDCGIAVFDGALGDGCCCLLEFATQRLMDSLLAEATPDLTELARIIAHSLGDRACLIEVRSLHPPHWLWSA